MECAKIKMTEKPVCNAVENILVVNLDGSGIPLTKIVGLTVYFNNGKQKGNAVLAPEAIKTLKSYKKAGCKIGFSFSVKQTTPTP